MNNPDTLQNRRSAVAGQFYPADSNELHKMISGLFSATTMPVSEGEVMAVIVPHAGYVFSGEVAAAAFGQLNRDKHYRTVFILGSSHQSSFPGASVYSIGNYVTPFGTVQTDLEVAEKLVKENKILAFNPQYHLNDHPIEVEIPFLQFWLKSDFKIVPIMLGTQDENICKKLAEILQPYFTPENLFVISTDFSHYPAYEDAVKIDKITADAIVTNDPDKLLSAIKFPSGKKAANMATACCSWPSVLTLMYLTEENPDIGYKTLMYKNSGDSQYGEKDRVVGYYALSVSLPKQKLILSDEEKQELLAIARSAIKSHLLLKKIPDLNEKILTSSLKTKAGAFVSLHQSGELRGCIGHFEAENSLYKTVQEMAVAAATEDSRFRAVTLDELQNIDIEISVLTPLQRITDIHKIRLGTDGIYIKKGNRSGTFLPQVATETGWELEEFLGHCARDKAGIGWDEWKDKDVEIYVYQSIVFAEKK